MIDWHLCGGGTLAAGLGEHCAAVDEYSGRWLWVVFRATDPNGNAVASGASPTRADALHAAEHCLRRIATDFSAATSKHVIREIRLANDNAPAVGQSRKGSAIEAVANVAVGYGIAVATQIAVFPLFGIKVAATDHLAIAGLFTVVSLARSYVLRRAFNWFHVRRART